MISYAQAREDVLLWRALAGRVHHEVGFWIDVGAFDPIEDSVTKVFSEHGWRGINIEPIEANYRRLVEDRPHDINLKAVISDKAGQVDFHEVVGHQLGTLEARFGDRHAQSGYERRVISVPAYTLTQICEQHAPQEIHFLKIDVEGHEASVIKGMDFVKFRPWILMVEACEPNEPNKTTHHEWDHLLLGAGYTYTVTDFINRVYVAEEHSELVPSLSFPADDYMLARDLRRIQQAEAELATLRAEL